MAASDESELVKMINTSTTINNKPCAFRYPRGNGLGVALPNITETISIGKGRILKEGKNVAILNFGARLQECLKATESKPIDQDLILELCSNHEVLITIEEGSIGGFGSHVMHFLSSRGILDKGIKLRCMILPDIFIDQDTPENMYKRAGLNSISIEEKVLEALKSNVVLSKKKSIS